MDGFSLLAGNFLTDFAILLACALGIPVPEEITLLSVGALVAAKQLNLYHAVAAGVTGTFFSDTVLFFIGRCFGSKWFSIPFVGSVLNQSYRKRMESCINKNGALICFLGRFLPGLRVVIFTTAGMLGVTPKMFLAIDILAAVIDVSFWIFIGNWLGNIIGAMKYTEEIKTAIMILVLSFLLLNI